MLSRVADSLYWINRYLERAENISRFLEVSEAMALDCPPGSAEPWLPLVEVTGDRHRFDTAYPRCHAQAGGALPAAGPQQSQQHRELHCDGAGKRTADQGCDHHGDVGADQ